MDRPQRTHRYWSRSNTCVRVSLVGCLLMVNAASNQAKTEHTERDAHGCRHVHHGYEERTRGCDYNTQESEKKFHNLASFSILAHRLSS